MASSRKRRRGDSTVIMNRGEKRDDRLSATQILDANELRGKGGGRVGESSVILREGERIRRTGPGVAVKFAVAVSAAIAVSMLLFGLVIYDSVEGALNDEIDAAGVAAARALAVPDFFTWNVFHRAYQGTPHGGFEEEIAEGDYKIPAGTLTDEQLAAAERRMGFNREKLQRLLEGQRILDAVIFNADQSVIVRSASGAQRLRFNGTSREQRDNVVIGRGTYVGTGERQYEARSFTAPIVDEGGRTRGHATIVLSEASIAEKLAAVRRQILVLTLVFVLVGVGVAFLLARQVTKPISTLTSDVETIARGNLEHRPRVHTTDELGVLSRTIERMAKSLTAAQSKEIEHARQKHQLSIALEIQNRLFPQELPAVPDYELESHYHPGPDVGGDYYDVFHLPDGRLFAMVASASGRGIPAAMLTTMARSFTTALAEREGSVSELLKGVNRLLSPDLRRGMYVTALAMVLDPKTGRVVTVNAGHNALIRYEAKSKQVLPVHSDGIALGFDKGPVFDRSLKEVELQLEPGDRLVMCTPGVFGITNHEGEELGEENFFRLVAREGAKNTTAFVNLVAHTLEKFTAGGFVETDITFVTLRRTP